MGSWGMSNRIKRLERMGGAGENRGPVKLKWPHELTEEEKRDTDRIKLKWPHELTQLLQCLAG